MSWCKKYLNFADFFKLYVLLPGLISVDVDYKNRMFKSSSYCLYTVYIYNETLNACSKATAKGKVSVVAAGMSAGIFDPIFRLAPAIGILPINIYTTA